MADLGQEAVVTPKQKYQMPTSTQVLRGVEVHAQPHTLIRAGRGSIGMTAGRVHLLTPSHRPESLHDIALAVTTPACAQAFAEGRDEGYAAGRLAAAAQEQQARQAVIDQARVGAAEEGRLQGLCAGRAEARDELEQALKEAQATVSDRLERLEQMLCAVAKEGARRLADSEDELIALSYEATCRVLGSEAATLAGIRSMVKHLLASHGHREQFAVHVHPDDLPLVSQGAGQVGESWRWVGDDSVQLGGLVLRSAQGTLDARLEVQLAALAEALLTVRRNRNGAPPLPAAAENSLKGRQQ